MKSLVLMMWDKTYVSTQESFFLILNFGHVLNSPSGSIVFFSVSSNDFARERLAPSLTAINVGAPEFTSSQSGRSLFGGFMSSIERAFVSQSYFACSGVCGVSWHVLIKVSFTLSVQ
jgi:hypothetical protein